MYVCVCTCVCTWVDVLSMHGPARLTPTPPINPPPTPRPHNTLNPPLNPFYTIYIYIKQPSWPAFEPRFVIDTGRNGKGDMRKSCSNWCNIRGAGIGQRPTTDTGMYLSICVCVVCVGMWGSGADGTDGRGGPTDQSSRHCPSTHPDGTSNQSLTPSLPHPYHQPNE